MMAMVLVKTNESCEQRVGNLMYVVSRIYNGLGVLHGNSNFKRKYFHRLPNCFKIFVYTFISIFTKMKCFLDIVSGMKLRK